MIRSCIVLWAALFFFASIQAAGANEACESVVLEKPNVELSVAQVQKHQTDWKRAIDLDKAADLWRLINSVDVTATNDKGKTALMAALKIGDQCLVEELMQRGLGIADKGYTGGTTLMYAVLGNQTKMIDFVLSRKPELDAQSTNGWTAVMIAAAKGFKEPMQQLVTAGADVNLADVYRWTPLMRAIDNRHGFVVNYLLSLPETEVLQINENGSTALHIAAQTGDQAIVRRLLALGANVDVVDKNGFTAGQIALEKNNAEVVQLLN